MKLYVYACRPITKIYMARVKAHVDQGLYKAQFKKAKFAKPRSRITINTVNERVNFL